MFFETRLLGSGTLGLSFRTVWPIWEAFLVLWELLGIHFPDPRAPIVTESEPLQAESQQPGTESQQPGTESQQLGKNVEFAAPRGALKLHFLSKKMHKCWFCQNVQIELPCRREPYLRALRHPFSAK